MLSTWLSSIPLAVTGVRYWGVQGRELSFCVLSEESKPKHCQTESSPSAYIIDYSNAHTHGPACLSGGKCLQVHALCSALRDRVELQLVQLVLQVLCLIVS
jgi:hypothetical protein